MNKTRLIGVLCAVLFSFITMSANAVLDSVPGGQVVYDTHLEISWVSDANLAASNTFGVPGIDANGMMTWAKANEWIGAMNAASYLGFSDWRLPTTLQPDATCSNQYDAGSSFPLQGFGTGCTGSEMGHLYNFEGVTSDQPDLFSNVQPFSYWSGTDFAPNTARAWGFDFSEGPQTEGGNQEADSKPITAFAWAVRDGGVTVDTDGDSIPDTTDNCPVDENPLQGDNDMDDLGDVCDPDDDNDTIADLTDNCPLASNIFQEDNDFDGLGNACDTIYDAGSVAQHVDDVASEIVSVLTALNVPGGNGIISKLTGNGGVTRKVSNAVITFGVAGDLESYLSDLASALNQLNAAEQQVNAKANKPKGISDPELAQIYAGIGEMRSTIEGLILEAGGTP